MNNFQFKIDRNSNITIQQQLINTINRAIANHQLEHGDNLPSINKISSEQRISRDTVFKAYQELKRIKIVDSTPAKGYFVNQQQKKILLLLDYFSPFKELLHNSFKKAIPAEYTIDLVFHHYNNSLFEFVVQQSIGMYDVYIIMNLDTSSFKINHCLKKIDPSKLLLIDIPVKNWNGFNPEKYAAVYQDFDQIVYDELVKIKEVVTGYKSFNLINTRNLNHPNITVEYFKRYCTNFKIEHNVYDNIESVDDFENQAFFVLRQSDLSNLLRKCKDRSLVPGKKVGIITYNDSPLYEFIGTGISVISTDFSLMGKKAAEFVIKRNVKKELIPTKIILRGSL